MLNEDDPGLTPTQLKYVKAVNRHGSARAAARALGVDKSSVSKALKRAARKGHITPEQDADRILPAGYSLGKRTVEVATTLPDGRRVRVWDRQHPDRLEELIPNMLAAIEIPRAKRLPAPSGRLYSDLLQVYPIGDAHFGMLAWQKEVGQDYDVQIAHDRMGQVSRALIAGSPAAEQALIVNVGDFFHTDNKRGITERGGNVLDTDSRLGKMVNFGTGALLSMIDCALRKHTTVEVWCVPGNHDDLLSWMLAKFLWAWYRNEPRVKICVDPKFFFYREFGRNLIGSTHGHGPRPAELGGVMATDQPEAWGRTEWWHWITGHIHHKTQLVSKEHRKVIVESFNTLAPQDWWHHFKGYRSRQNMQSITFDLHQGEVERHTVNVSRAAA